MLSKCFDISLPTRICEERMWGTFHQLGCSQSFRDMWSTFLMRTLSVDACPIFYRYITDTFFRLMIKEQLKLTKEESCSGEQSLTYNKKNALRFAAGFVIRHLQKQIKRSAHPHKDELELCLIELNDGSKAKESDESGDWVKNIDRGGLTHISNMNYMMFEAMELQLHKHLKISNMVCGSRTKGKVETEILNSEDVLFYWCIVSAEWDEDKLQNLLHIICGLKSEDFQLSVAG